MKSTRLFFMLLVFALSTTLNGQNRQAKQALPESSEKTFFSIQKAFNDYWEPFNVAKDGYYTENGDRKKAAGWKQFKRWEWYWESRVDPTTGVFPNKHASDYFTPRKGTSGSRSPSGSWSSLGPSSSSGGYAGLGRLNCVAFRSGDNNTIYVGSPSGGLWKSTDGGTNWTVLTDQNDVLGVSDAVVVAGTSPATDIVYIGTGDRDGGSMWSLGGGQSNDNNSIGVLKSVDGGTSWATTGLTFTANQKRTINRMLLNPNDDNMIYAATSVGLYQTTDAGVSWAVLDATEFIDIKYKPGDVQIIYASTRAGKIYRSTNAGSSWTLILDKYAAGGRRVDLAVSANQPSWVYAVMVNSSGGLYGIYKSTDSGASFSLVFDGGVAGNNILHSDCSGGSAGGQGSYDLAIASDPNNANIVFVGGVNAWKSTNGGSNWSVINMWSSSCGGGAAVVHADKHFMAYQNGTSTLFECNDGGIYKTSNAGTSWTHLSNGLEISQMYRLGVSQTDPNEYIAGLQDNGTKSRLTGTWTDVIGGDGMDCMIDYTDKNIQYGEYQYGGLYRTTSHWAGTDTDITGGLSGSAYWVMPIAIDPNVNTTIYAALQDVFKSTNQGTSWTKISNWAGSSLKELTIAPSNSNYIYTTTQSILYRSANGGTSWSNITGSLPVGSSLITYIAVKDDDPNTVWVSMGQYNTDGVYQSTDGGTTWTNISAGLPSVPVMCVVQNKLNTTDVELYAGTDVGVYVKIGAGNWSLFSTGLPNVVVNELKIYYNSGTPSLSRIRAATSGRGLWESELYSPANIPPVANFSADITNPGVGQTVTFSDLSTNQPTAWTWSFTPSTVSYVGGTSASSQNPQVQFNATGNYTVNLTSSNAYGSDVENKVDYISVTTLLTYCTASGGGDEYISGVQVGTINNTGTGSDSYTNYTTLSTDLTINQSNSITINYGVAYSTDDLGVWIDLNQDGDFDDANENLVCTVGIAYLTETYTFTIPAEALLGSTSMRIRLKYTNVDCGLPCGVTDWGEVEDYKVNILPGLNNWLGYTTDWYTPTNWSDNAVPTSSYNVIIPIAPVGGNFPIVPTGNAATCNDIILNDGAHITVNGTLTVGN